MSVWKKKEEGLATKAQISILRHDITWSLPRGYLIKRLAVSRDYRVRSSFSLLSTPMSQHLWLRCEKKEFERRAALSPKNAKALIDAGFTIHVERDEQRIFDDSEYESYAPFY
jgi:hypothetical protein